MADHRILKHLPEFYGNIEDFVGLAVTETIELNLMEDAFNQLFDDQFVMTSGLQAIKRREKMLGIQADPTTETLDFRRRRILNRYQTKPPFTIRYLQQLLDILVGRGKAIVSRDLKNHLLIVTANIDNAAVFKEVGRTVEVIKPANMIYRQQTSLEDVIELDEHISTQVITWNYKLEGSWLLGEKSFSDLGQEVVVK
ncbi:DUF2313 domain-containing protein [Paenibacillus donghaensis]|uniref:putative phage tail protein n=1 Tax=Paenibacillus donghaensis TaxID=414771 RepID=UPI001883B326|nr:putative phage tail protein [Paenibacillus donghaensis]MBE9913371.1 DUF2313 domain-containing protein [Paenibacillus donghaensis]